MSTDENLRIGNAGMHDIISIKNINRDMKKAERVELIDSIFLTPPPNFDPAIFNVLLLQGPHDEREGFALFPLGLGYVARMIHEIGINVSVVDAHAEGLGVAETIHRILDSEFNVLGITALSTQYDFVKQISIALKKHRPEVLIILGGQLAHYNSHTVIEHTGVDICVIGEGEITIQDIFFNVNHLNEVDGIAYRNHDGIYTRNRDRVRIKNLDIVPMPYYDIFNMEYYVNNGFYGARSKRAINVLSSRGCPYSCTFCSLSFPNVTYRSIDSVIDEIKYLKDKFQIDGVSFCDELFILNKKRILEFAEKVSPLKIKWGGQGRANVVNDDVDFLKKIKASGASYIGFGLESATSEMLTAMQKKTTVEQNTACMVAARAAGLTVVAQYMFGFPGESIESIAAGIDYFDRVHYIPPVGPDSPAHISITIPLPGSQLYEDSKANGLIVDEDEYLSKISIGYMESKEIIINLTSFSDDELLELKKFAERKMEENYYEWIKVNDRFARQKNLLKKIIDVTLYEGPKSLALKLYARIIKIIEMAGKGDFSGIQQLISSRYPNQNYIFRTGKVRDLEDAVKQLRANLRRFD